MVFRFRKHIAGTLALMLVIYLVAAAVLPQRTASATSVLLLGDSITEGAWRANRVPYRLLLWKQLRKNNHAVDFVGSWRGFHGDFWPLGELLWPWHDLDHEGHWGWETGEVLNRLPGWLQGYPVDIALVHLGSNDIDRGQSVVSTIDELTGIIGLLRDKNNRVVILLAQIIPIRGIDVTEYNNAITELAPALSNEHSPIVIVDQHSGYNLAVHNYDKYHPNKMGAQRMAEIWYLALRDYLPEAN